MSEIIPVLIVGAGPTGLNLANLLCQYDIPFRLIEQKSTAITTSNALAVQPRSLEMWQRMGIAEKALSAGKKIMGLALHSGKRKIGEVSFKNVHLPTQFPFILGLPQADTEHLLTEHLESQGRKIERGASLVDFKQIDQTIHANVEHPDGRKEEITCAWLIAADGAHSTVRKNLNLPFAGATIPEKFIMADIVMKTDFNPDYFHAFSSTSGPLVFAPMPKFTRLICAVTNDPSIKDFINPTLADFQQAIATRSPAKVTIDSVVWISHFVTHHRLIDNYCHGRVIFAGDSAHIHSPVGGQGMNTGMQDTFNLAWKLAAVIQGKSKPSLLESYSNERRSVAKNILSGTTKMTKIVTLGNPLLVAIRNHLMGFLFKFSSIQKKIIMNISELATAYAANGIISGPAGQRAPAPQLFQGTKHTLIFFPGKNYSEKNAQAILQVAKTAQENQADFFDVIIASDNNKYFPGVKVLLDPEFKFHDSYAMQKGGVCIVRPDLYVGMSSNKISYATIEQYVKQIKV